MGSTASPFARVSARLIALATTLTAAASTTIALAAAPASAGLLSTVSNTLPNCGARDAGTPFARWGDNHAYFLMPGGGFEAGSPEWKHPGSTIVSGNETFYANARTDSKSLAVPTGATVTSPTVCVAMGENSVRFFVRNPGVAGATLHVQAYVQNPLTGLVLSTGFDVKSTTGAKSWAPSDRMSIPNLLGGVLGAQNVRLVFSARGTATTWNVDDVFVDPFRSR